MQTGRLPVCTPLQLTQKIQLEFNQSLTFFQKRRSRPKQSSQKQPSGTTNITENAKC